MAYRCDLGNHQSIYLDYQTGQTIVTVLVASPGQQQQSTNRFQTGIWTSPPQAFQTPTGIVLQLHTTQGDIWLQVQGHSTTIFHPSSVPTEPLSMQQVDAVAEMAPMQPMQPMRMGNMAMSLEPMEMRMGNMEMRMGSAAGVKFCRQCGASIQPDDRFCSKCGTRLQ